MMLQQGMPDEIALLISWFSFLNAIIQLASTLK